MIPPVLVSPTAKVSAQMIGDTVEATHLARVCLQEMDLVLSRLCFTFRLVKRSTTMAKIMEIRTAVTRLSLTPANTMGEKMMSRAKGTMGKMA